jgi:hypothetical protein
MKGIFIALLDIRQYFSKVINVGHISRCDKNVDRRE